MLLFGKKSKKNRSGLENILGAMEGRAKHLFLLAFGEVQAFIFVDCLPDKKNILEPLEKVAKFPLLSPIT